MVLLVGKFSSLERHRHSIQARVPFQPCVRFGLSQNGMPAVIELLGVPHGTFEFPEWLGMVCARHEALTSLHLALFGLQSEGTRSARDSLGAGLAGAHLSIY